MKKTDKKNKSNFSKRLLNLREDLGLSTRQLGELIQVDQSAIVRWENGENNPTGPAKQLIEIFEFELNGEKHPILKQIKSLLQK